MKRSDKFILFFMSLYILLLPLCPTTKYEWALNIFIIIVSGIYLYELVFYKNELSQFQKNFKKIFFEKFTILFFMYVIWMVISSIYSVDRNQSLKEAARYFQYFYVYLLIRFRFYERKYFETFVKIYIFSVFIVSIFGAYDFFSHYKSKENIMYILENARVKSTLGHPNAYGAYLILSIFPIISIACSVKGWKRIIFSLLAILIFINITLTFSRNAWLALAIGIVLLTVIYNWRFISLFILPLFLVLFNGNILNRIEQFKDAGFNYGRFRLWNMALKIIKEHFILGVGADNFTVVFKEYLRRFPENKLLEAETLPPHNSFIRAFVELGVVGGIIFILFCLNIIYKLNMVRNKSKGLLKYFYSGYFISAICFFAMNCFDDLFFIPKVTFNFIFFVAMAYSIHFYES